MPGQSQNQPQEAYDIWAAEFQKRYEPNFAWKSVIAQYLALPGLRGFWPMSSVDYQSANQGIDLSGQGNHLTNNNTATFGYNATNLLVPQVDLDGTNQYLSKADGGAANWADIIGTEAYISQNGMTLGCWVFFDDASPATGEYMIAKYGAAGQRSYRLQRQAIGAGLDSVRFSVSTDGTNMVNIASTTIPTNTGWYFFAGRFDPSTELAIWTNPSVPPPVDTLAVGVPATISDSTSAFTVGATAVPGNYLDGKISMAFLCAAYVPDVTIWQLYQQSRVMFNR